MCVTWRSSTRTARCRRTDQPAIQSEVNQLASEIERIGQSASFNGISLLSQASTISFQIGSNDGQVITASTISPRLGPGHGVLLADRGGHDRHLGDRCGDQRRLGAALDLRCCREPPNYTLDNAAIYEENLTASESRIRDVDMASEMVNFTKLQILQQAGTSMLSQANQSSQSVLTLLH